MSPTDRMEINLKVQFHLWYFFPPGGRLDVATNGVQLILNLSLLVKPCCWTVSLWSCKCKRSLLRIEKYRVLQSHMCLQLMSNSSFSLEFKFKVESSKSFKLSLHSLHSDVLFIPTFSKRSGTPKMPDLTRISQFNHTKWHLRRDTSPVAVTVTNRFFSRSFRLPEDYRSAFSHRKCLYYT